MSSPPLHIWCLLILLVANTKPVDAAPVIQLAAVNNGTLVDSIATTEGRTLMFDIAVTNDATGSICQVTSSLGLQFFPFVNGTQFGANVPLVAVSSSNPNAARVVPRMPLSETVTATASGEGVKTSCHFSFMLPFPLRGDASVSVSLLRPPYFPTTFTVGDPIPSPTDPVFVQSSVNNVSVTVGPFASKTRKAKAGVRRVIEWEPWFTPVNIGNWETSEAVPLCGHYSSIDVVPSATVTSAKALANRNVIRQHTLWFYEARISAIAIDWTNNVWSTPTWGGRGVFAQQLINATQGALEYMAEMEADPAVTWTMPKFVLLLGLDNGPLAPAAALNGEVEWITANFLNHTGIRKLFIDDIDQKPLLVLFDGGNIHSQHPLDPRVIEPYTLRFMASQLQVSHLNEQGFYSWMDGSIAPAPTPSRTPGLYDALTITNAFFPLVGRDWLNANAVATNNGATLLQESWTATQYRPTLLFICQWNEFAGQPNSAPGWTDSYNATLSNDMEPVSLSACGGIQRPNGAGYCGGDGFRYLNQLKATGSVIDQADHGADNFYVVISSPVPWLAVPADAVSLNVSFVTFGYCDGLVSFEIQHVSLPQNNVTTTIRVPARTAPPSTLRNANYTALLDIPTLVEETLRVQWNGGSSASAGQLLAAGTEGLYWSEIRLKALKADGKTMCGSDVVLSYYDLSVTGEQYWATDSVAMRRAP